MQQWAKSEMAQSKYDKQALMTYRRIIRAEDIIRRKQAEQWPLENDTISYTDLAYELQKALQQMIHSKDANGFAMKAIRSAIDWLKIEGRKQGR
jgi:uncharacterized protein YicC (UPF0701 family)